MSRKSISWKLDLLSAAPRVFQSFLMVAMLCVGVFCCDVGKCLGQVSAGAPGAVLSGAEAGQNNGPVDSQAVRARFLEYERQLNAMLKTRRDEEKEFVGLVVNQIRLGLIPSKLVATSFEWVRNKRPTTKYPFVYFERVLRLQAGRLGMADQIPPFDFAVYSLSDQRLGPTGGILEAPTTDGAETERESSIFRLGGIILDRIRRF